MVSYTIKGWFRNLEEKDNINSKYSSCIALYSTKTPNVWEIAFWYDLYFLDVLFNKRFISGSEDEVKMEVDLFIKKMIRLRSFL